MYRKLAPSKRLQVVRRFVNGEKGAALGAEFGVGPHYAAVAAFNLKEPKRVMLSKCPHCGEALTVTRQ